MDCGYHSCVIACIRVEATRMTTAAVNIPIGGFKDVYDVAEVDRALQDLSSSANDALKSTYEKMIKAGGTRLTVKPSGIPAMESLYDELPNFAEVLDDVRSEEHTSELQSPKYLVFRILL